MIDSAIQVESASDELHKIVNSKAEGFMSLLTANSWENNETTVDTTKMINSEPFKCRRN